MSGTQHFMLRSRLSLLRFVWRILYKMISVFNHIYVNNVVCIELSACVHCAARLHSATIMSISKSTPPPSDEHEDRREKGRVRDND